MVVNMLKQVLLILCCYSIGVVNSQCGSQQAVVESCFAEKCASQNCSVKYDLTANFTFEDLDNDAKLCDAFNTAICSTVSCCSACSEETRTFGQCTLDANSQALKDCAFDTCGLNSGGGPASSVTGVLICALMLILGIF
jgi:hypothetical protein